MKRRTAHAFRACVVVATATAAWLGATTPAQTTEARGGVVREAAAQFFVRTDRTDVYRWYYVTGRERVDAVSGRVTQDARVVVGRCTQIHTDGGRALRCSGRGLTHDRRPRVDIDVLGGTARVVVEARGAAHVVRWAVDGAPADGAYTADETCDAGAGAGGGYVREAVARGRILGVPLETEGKRDFALLTEGALATQC